MIVTTRGSVRAARLLLWITIAWNIIEGIVGVAAGLVAGSLVLTAFGLDSGIEVVAAGILLWRLADNIELRSGPREEIAHRIVGVTFLALAAYVVADGVYALATRREPGVSPFGLGLAVSALIVMPTLSFLKRKNGADLGSPAILAEAAETLLCGLLALTVLVGLIANAVAGWWWADILAAATMLPLMIREGLEGLRGEDD